MHPERVSVVGVFICSRFAQFTPNTIFNGPITANVNVRKNLSIWCKGDKSNIENSTDHFCEDTRQNVSRSRDPI